MRDVISSGSAWMLARRAAILVLDNCRATIERCVIFELRAKNELKSRLFFVSFVAAVAAFGASVTVLGSRIVHANLQEDDLGGQQLQKPPVEQHILKITRRVLCLSDAMLRAASTAFRASNRRFAGSARLFSTEDGSHSDFAPQRKAPATSSDDEVTKMLQEVNTRDLRSPWLARLLTPHVLRFSRWQPHTLQLSASGHA